MKKTKKILASLVKHPNAGAVLVIELGCENLTHDDFIAELGDYDKERVFFLKCQDVDNEYESARALLKKCVEYALQFTRRPIPVSELIIGLKCGASDGLSGITANPVIGQCCDMTLSYGASAILSEIPEMFGAENIIMNRCINSNIFEKLKNAINGYKEYFKSHNTEIYENPSPGNKMGGITTLEEKSCGCVQKAGHYPIVDVIPYGDFIKCKGLNVLCGPGNDMVSTTALVAAGAHLVLFSTGRGTPFGTPVPTIKIASNSNIVNKKKHWIDFNTSSVIDEGNIDNVANKLFDLVIDVAEGKQTNNEKLGYRDIAIFKDGVIL